MFSLKYAKTLLAGSVLGFLVAVGALWTKHEKYETPDDELASYVFYKADIGAVEKFKDNSIMHGPTYFFFETTELNVMRIIEWLRLEKQTAIPSLFTELIATVQSEVAWGFNWETNQVYTTYYCHSSGNGWDFDMLLVDQTRVVYATSGFMDKGSSKVPHLDLCKKTNGPR